jgi:hypothetical protein
VLACGLISNPISDVQNAASTAEAFASDMPVETLQSLTTALPVQTIEALPSSMPEIDKYFNPSGTPVEEWNGIPIMPQATVGEEFGESTYSFTAPVTATDVQTFYNQSLEELGWTSAFSLPVSDEGGILSFQMDNDFLIITITPDQEDSNNVDVLIQK